MAYKVLARPRWLDQRLDNRDPSPPRAASLFLFLLKGLIGGRLKALCISNAVLFISPGINRGLRTTRCVGLRVQTNFVACENDENVATRV